MKSGGATDNTLAPWDELLADVGAKIIKSRRGFIKSLLPIASEFHGFLSDGRETLALEYEGQSGETVDIIKEGLLKRISADRDADLRLKYTHSGPHKDDIKITVDGVDLRAFGSQGQQRTAALAMKLAEMRILSEVLGTSPVLLLDDVFSELDSVRRNKLMAATAGFQSIITATDKTDFDGFDVNIVEI